MALSGTFNFYEVSQFGLYCEWYGKQNNRTNSTSITVDVYLRHCGVVTDECDGVISVGGRQRRFKSKAIVDFETSEWINVLIGTSTINIPHDANGLCDNLVISVDWGFNNTYNGVEINTIHASTVENLTKIPVYELMVESDMYSAITVNRISSGAGTIGELSNGDILYSGDRLRIYFSAIDGYQVATHTVNNYTFVSGGTLFVDGTINIVCSSQEAIREPFIPENMQCFNANGDTLRFLYQWDKNVEITIKDVAVNPPPVFQFANRHTRTSINAQSTVRGKDLAVTIPNELLEYPEAIFAYICRSSGDSVRTLGSIHIPVYTRVRPGDSEHTNE